MSSFLFVFFAVVGICVRLMDWLYSTYTSITNAFLFSVPLNRRTCALGFADRRPTDSPFILEIRWTFVLVLAGPWLEFESMRQSSPMWMGWFGSLLNGCVYFCILSWVLVLSPLMISGIRRTSRTIFISIPHMQPEITGEKASPAYFDLFALVLAASRNQARCRFMGISLFTYKRMPQSP